ncbi:MAG: AAA domain-containing protein [Candidatus Helarchaeota archaeon]
MEDLLDLYEAKSKVCAQQPTWEQTLYNFVNNSVSPGGLTPFLRRGPSLPFNREQRRAARAISSPLVDVPQSTRSNQTPQRVGIIPPEQQKTYTDPGPDFHLSRKVVAANMIIGPPGTGKTHTICSGSILRAFDPHNLSRGNPQHLYIATFSNAGSYRIYEKFHEIATLANTSQYHERIKLVQSRNALESYAFNMLRTRLGLNPDDFFINNRMPFDGSISREDWRDFLGEILIYVGTTDSLSILGNDTNSNATAHGVIFDEASQITVPQFYQVFPTHAISSICVVGDDCQLPPVSTLAPLGISAIEYLRGINRYQNTPIPNSRIIELQRQYRMHPSIAQLTESILNTGRVVIPAGPTTDLDYQIDSRYNLSNIPHGMAQSTINILSDVLHPEHALIIADTSNVTDAIDRQVGSSRMNKREGMIAVGIRNALLRVYRSLGGENIIITAPYRRQIGIFRSHGVETGTVHQFQGQEAEVVIYSLTFARPATKSEFFSQVELMYVGLSRAKKKLIVLGNRAAMNHPDRAIQHIRNTIFDFQYQGGRPGFPAVGPGGYPRDPVCHVNLDDQFFNDINNYLI